MGDPYASSVGDNFLLVLYPILRFRVWVGDGLIIPIKAEAEHHST
jgi:hypothetical protein